MDFVGSQIVHDHDVAVAATRERAPAPHRRGRRRRSSGPRGPWARDAVVAQPGGEGGGFPMAMRYGARIAHPWAPTVKARHFGVRGGLVDEDDPRRIEVELSLKPCLTRCIHRAATLFGGVRRLFLRVILRRLKNRQSVPTATPRSFNPLPQFRQPISLWAARSGACSTAISRSMGFARCGGN